MGIEEEGGEGSSWLAELVSPSRLERVRNYPAYAEGSAEYALFAILEADLNEKGAAMDPAKRARLRNLVGVLRMVFYPNLPAKERGYSDYVLGQVDLSTTTYEVTKETRNDVRWIYETFGLIPTRQQLSGLPPVVKELLPKLD